MSMQLVNAVESNEKIINDKLIFIRTVSDATYPNKVSMSK